jgi:hypothetical protein
MSIGMLLVTTEMTLNQSEVTVWCAISSLGVLGPYFFDEMVNVATVCGTTTLKTFTSCKMKHLHILQMLYILF